jgi:predicted 3-demethylubiquinone-9 3-methyltransferase (glyoxalase superfamily)
MASIQKIAACLWFDNQAEEAAKFYVSVFEDSKIESVAYYGKEGVEIHGRTPGTVMTVAFRLGNQQLTALNGGPQFKFSEAVSFQVFCDTQAEVDYFWSTLSKGGSEGPCGWLKDKFGLSWQVVPSNLDAMLRDPDTEKSQRVTKAFLKMKKFDLAALKRAYEGKSAD